MDVKTGMKYRINMNGEGYDFHVEKVSYFGNSIPTAEGYLVLGHRAFMNTRLPLSVIQDGVMA